MLVLSYTSLQPTAVVLTAFSENLFVAIDNPAAIQIVWRKLDGDLVPRKDTNEILAHLAGHMRQHFVLVLQLHPEHGVRQWFQNNCHHFNRVFFAHRLLKSFYLVALGS